MVRTTRKKLTRTGKHAAGAERGEQPAEVNDAAEARRSDEATKMVAHLSERAFRGRPGGLHCLNDVSNMAPREEEPGTTQSDFSQAVAWMSEPEWNGESSEGMSETSAGSREPECGMD